MIAHYEIWTSTDDVTCSDKTQPEPPMNKCKKIRYKDKIAAMLALAKCNRAKKGRRQERAIYYCRPCRSFHLTSK